MKYIYDEVGQLCNRFWSYLDTVSWAVANGKKVRILFWDKNISDYDKLRHNRYVSFPLYRPYLIRLLGEKKYNHLIRVLFKNRLAKSFYSSSFAKKMGFIEGWPKRLENQNYALVKSEVNALFMPNESVRIKVDGLLKPFKAQENVIVGVHIRRGDYKEWQGGKYFFEHEQYRKKMREISQMLIPSKTCFYIASNEPIPWDYFKEFPLCNVGVNARASEDLYALSRCDKIIGPLSTFSTWASMIGEVPLCVLQDANQEICNDSFHIYTSLSE